MVTLGAFADHIDQLDLALDQLAMKDRHFDRFALMLVDNVVELVLHENALERSSENQFWVRLKKSKYDQNAINAALGRHFDAKVKFAKETKLLSPETAETIQYLHGFRNNAYHLGRRHEGILHSLSLLYFRTACGVLGSYEPRGWSSGPGKEGTSHRAMKYLGRADRAMFLDWKKVFRPAFERLREVADAMGDVLALDLHNDASRTIDRIDQALDFVEENQPDRPKKSRSQIAVDAQVWALAFSDGLEFAAKKKAPPMSRVKLIEWLATNYPLRVRGDPVAGWRRRAGGIKREKNPHAALKKYCDFMAQTEVVREQIHAHAAGLDEAIQEHIDYLRGK